MFIMHIALQGCLKSRDVAYGITPDTGGHIKFVLELAAAAEAHPEVSRQEIVTRRFRAPGLDPIHDQRVEKVSDTTRIVRIEGTDRAYLAKEVMHFQNPAMAADLERHLRTLPHLPDVIHAHYADAGWIAAEMQARLGIPYVFTGHSLGAVKHAVMGAAAPALTRRIAIEERAIDRADRVIVSSFDEAEYQYGLYHATRPERVRVNPPGCDLDALTNPDPAYRFDETAIERFLHDPGKRPILAIARPVAKKNLAGLVRAFAGNDALRERANLIVYAGTRSRIAEEDEEPRHVLDELLRLVDDHDLWGQIALPKHHAPADVPHIYAYAARRRGIFANPALNEPFGLTILEAAAAGLPVVATRSGGPNDIVGRLENGILVDPEDTRETGEALLALAKDDVRHARLAQNGRTGVRHYAWPRHVADYVRDLRCLPATGTLARPAVQARPERRRARKEALLVCDIDGTLTGCRKGLGHLRRWLSAHPSVGFAIATGRSLHKAEDLIARWQVPVPDVLIASTGSEIYHLPERDLRRMEADLDWMRRGDADWQPSMVDAILRRLDGVSPQPPGEQRRFKRSFFVDRPGRTAMARAALEAAGLEAEVIHSPDRYLDVLPKGIGKGSAALEVARHLGVPVERVFAAGHSGNDMQLLAMAGHAIVVGNHAPALRRLSGRYGAYFAQAHHAGGIVEGLERVGLSPFPPRSRERSC